MPSRDNLRSASDCFKISTNHNFDKSISYKLCTTWNLLPIELREISSIIDFKKKLKTYFFKLAFDV